MDEQIGNMIFKRGLKVVKGWLKGSTIVRIPENCETVSLQYQKKIEMG